MSIHFDEWAQVILKLDREIFEWSIIYMNPKWLTSLCAEFTKTKYLAVILTPLLLFYFWKDKKGCLLFVICVIVLMVISELAAAALKYSFGRLRPGVQTGLYLKTDAYSFPSAHAWNSMALFVFVALWFGRYKFFWITLSILVGTARFLDNDHFLLDVVFGWLGGGFYSYLFFGFVSRFYHQGWGRGGSRGSKRRSFWGLPRPSPQK